MERVLGSSSGMWAQAAPSSVIGRPTSGWQWPRGQGGEVRKGSYKFLCLLLGNSPHLPHPQPLPQRKPPPMGALLESVFPSEAAPLT